MCARCPILALALFFAARPSALAAADTSPSITISVIGTSDLHGHIAALPWLGGYLKNLRGARALTGGAVIVLDAGDMFQGTLESNLEEGAPVIRAYNALGYSAVAIGNHEFDFGPVGPAPAPVKPGDDPRGALKARASQAQFPFLAANIVDKATGKCVAWPNLKPSTIISAAGIKIGIIGVITATTAHSALPANVVGLAFLPLAPTVAAEARRLRAKGATVVIVAAHEGGACRSFADPDKLDSCDASSEIFSVVRGLPKGSVDAVVAGHTHQALAHRVESVPIIQSYANGRAFGRVDLTVERASGRVLATELQAPREICPASTPANCGPGNYEGSSVQIDKDVAAAIAPAIAATRQLGQEDLGVKVLRPLPHNRNQETALGNLLADLMRTARPGSDVAVINGGGMRAELPAGPLTLGRLYETFPFDNALATARVSAGQLRRLLARSLGRSASLLSLSGLSVRARCEGPRLDVALSRPDGSPVHDNERFVLTTTDFLATGGDGLFTGVAARFEGGPPLRDALVEVLRARRGTLDPDDRTLFDPTHPRFDLPGDVPIHCP
ncbi:MAG: 5'-nucleotidase C-terminal domain-containing protein [Polyangia bacterium]